ncbi:MAG: BPL-N domain-containing protein [Candidatus Thorarchaeota archaeon]
MNTRKSITVILSLLLVSVVYSTDVELSVSTAERGLVIATSLQNHDLSGVSIAVFQGDNTEVANACRIAMVNMFEWMNATVDLVSASMIKEGFLGGYDVLGLPPGNLPSYNIQLGTQGLEAIRNYVSHGGAYFGVAGGAIFACDRLIYGSTNDEYLLKLYNGTVRGPITGVTDRSIEVMEVNTTNGVIDLTGVPSTLSTLYWGATYFIPNDAIDYVNIASAPDVSYPSLIAYQYGSGCVFLSGLHPEFEENSDRDGSSMFDDLDDPESEWPLMLRIARWMVDASVWITDSTSTDTTNTSTTDVTGIGLPDGGSFLIVAVAAFGIVIVVVVARMWRKR